MFEECTTVEDLNKQRVAMLHEGFTPAAVNKEYMKRKTMILTTQARSFKKLKFITMGVPQLEQIVGITSVVWDDEDPYTIYVD